MHSMAPLIKEQQKKEEINNFCRFKDSAIFDLELSVLITLFSLCMFATCWRAQFLHLL